MLKYKGYSGDVEYDDEAKIFHGEVLDTKDIITFQGKNVTEIEKSFRESIDDYLQFCKEREESEVFWLNGQVFGISNKCKSLVLE